MATVFFVCAGSLASAAASASNGTAITIYSSAQPGAINPNMYRPVPGQNRYQYGAIPGYAVVRQHRDMDLSRGRSSIQFTDVAALIDPTTVRFSSLTDPLHTRVIEQNFQFDLVSSHKLLEKYIDREISIDQVVGDDIRSITGTLLSVSGGIILRDRGGQIHHVNGYNNIRFPDLPGGLITRPTLVWDVDAARSGRHRTRIAYQTEGMTWWTDYNLVFEPGRDANSGTLDVAAWVSIINQSGASYDNATLKLIAGDVHRATRNQYSVAMKRAATMELAANSAASGFSEKSFFEFHMYTLGRPTTLPQNSTKQIELFPGASKVPAKKILVYYGLPEAYRGFYGSPMTDRNYGTEMNKKIDTYLQFKNEKKNGLGIPLPAGRIRVSRIDDADGSLEFIGEDIIDHTPKNEKVLIKMGSAFDVVGERRQTDFRVDVHGHWMEEEIEIKIRNHKDEAVELIVKENLYRWVNWDIREKNTDFEKTDARTVHFPVTVAADEEKIIRYRVHYSW
jgi:hypothetical protein